MVYFHAIGKAAVFHFDKIADVTVLRQRGAGAKLGEGANGAVLSHLHLAQH